MDGEMLKILRKSHVFDEIDNKDMMRLLHCLNSSVRSFPAGNYLIMEADDVRYVGLVLEGRVTIQKEDFLGNLTHLADIRVGELLGETFSLGAATQSAVTFVAATDCRVMFMPLWKILHICSNNCAFHSQLIVNMFAVLSEKNRKLMEKMSIISQPTIRDRLLAFFQNEAEKKDSRPHPGSAAESGYSVMISYSRQELADFLSVNRSALCRELSRMQKEKIIRVSGKQITVFQ